MLECFAGPLAMPYQTPITVKVALDRIFAHAYVLPAIQREFVCRPEQSCRLFDSLMRGYPVGSFLFWQVSARAGRATAAKRQSHTVNKSEVP